jgi:hypothetical protein
VGLPGVEGSAAEDSWMVHAQTADAVVGGGRRADFAMVDSGGSASGPILVDDREIPGVAGAAGLGSGVGGVGAIVRRRGVAGLFARAWKGPQHNERRPVSPGIDNDDVRLGGYLVESFHETEVARALSRPSNEGCRYTIPQG